MRRASPPYGANAKGVLLLIHVSFANRPQTVGDSAQYMDRVGCLTLPVVVGNNTAPMSELSHKSHEETESDGELFARLLMKHQPAVFTYLRSMVYRRSDVDDLLQEVAMTAWKQFGTYDRERPFELWLFGIARNLLLKYFREMQHDVMRFSDQTLELLASRSAVVSQRTDDYLHALDHCLGKLPERDRDLINRRYSDSGATNRSVALELGWSDTKMSRTMSRIYGWLMNCVRLHASGGMA